jgi:RNA polymerase sigma-70 factor, ECF subfamily
MAFPIPLHELWFGARGDSWGCAAYNSGSSGGDSSTPEQSTPRDTELVARLRGGDASALAELFDTLYKPLVGFAASFVESPEVAQEIVQEVFLHLWEGRAQWTVRDTARAYLFGAVRNLARNSIRRRRLELNRARLSDDAESMMGDPPMTASAIVEGLELREAVQRAFALLTPRRRLVLELRWYHGLNHGEVAEALGISVKGVEQNVTRALHDLRVLLALYDPGRLSE